MHAVGQGVPVVVIFTKIVAAEGSAVGRLDAIEYGQIEFGGLSLLCPRISLHSNGFRLTQRIGTDPPKMPARRMGSAGPAPARCSCAWELTAICRRSSVRTERVDVPQPDADDAALRHWNSDHRTWRQGEQSLVNHRGGYDERHDETTHGAT